MAVRLRLRRMGRKKRPFYRIVAADQRSPRDGRFIEVVGFYDPLGEEQKVELKEDRIYHWLENGAQPSDTVKSLLRKHGMLHRLNMQKLGMDEARIEEEMKKWELQQGEREKRREAAKKQSEKEAKEAAKKAAQEKAEAEKAAAAEAAKPEPSEEPAEAPAEETAVAEEAPEEAAVAEEKPEEAPAEAEAPESATEEQSETEEENK